ncbi:lipid-binding SYLF domain-containing protein [Bryobacter aggregatus]|uniref:lipid-binding SYLF domain-containing protein n=1 Tax=Bryobacter aggregatus TaxID=360054 RepID=UPI0004E10AB8|nr:lipid-binding SYLF domain-containing protein [Bryobacter aggregatus]
MKVLLTILTACGLMLGAKNQQAEAVKRLTASKEVLTDALNAGDKSIPRDLIEKAHCIAIIPSMKQGGFIVGAKYGKGVMFCRKESGGWRGPATVRIEGGSFGLQIGAGEADVIMLVMNKTGAEKILKNEFKLGANAGVMAGPLGRTAQAETDVFMRAEILGYSRSRGVFAGISLDGSTLREDLDDNAKLYGKKLSNEQILLEARPTPAVARPLRNMLNQISTWEKK